MGKISGPNDTLPLEKRWSIPARIGLLFGFWLLIGFALGTVFLLFPVRWWANLSRQNAWPDAAETSGVVLIIVVLVLVSFALANGAMMTFVRSGRFLTRALLVIVPLGAAATAYWSWIHPSTMTRSMAVEQDAGAHFTFGPFPDAARLAALRSQGYAGVISLLHPAVVPFEPQLIAQEKRYAAAAGIELIHLPMLPWVSENTESIEKLRAIAAAKEGRYYIHCYLGVDRVNVARRIIEQETGNATAIEAEGVPTRRSLDAKMEIGFERGPIYKLEEGLYLTPYPTDGEFLSYILSGEVKNVVALLDSRDPEEKTRIDYEQKLLASHALPFHLVEVGGDRYSGRQILEALEMAKKLERPTIIHSFFTLAPGRAAIAEAVLIAHRTGLPPLPPSMWQTPMQNGATDLIAPHIAVGQKPTAREYAELLQTRGVRTALFVGVSDGASLPERAAATQAGIELRVASPDPVAVLELVKSGGPYFLYGPGVASVRDAIGKRYAALMEPAKAPNEMRAASR